MKTRTRDGFKVVKTSAIHETAKFLAETHKLLLERIKYKANEVETVGTFD